MAFKSSQSPEDPITSSASAGTGTHNAQIYLQAAKQLGEESVNLAYVSMSLFITEGSQDKEESRDRS